MPPLGHDREAPVNPSFHPAEACTSFQAAPISSSKLPRGEMDSECLFLGPHACTVCPSPPA